MAGDRENDLASLSRREDAVGDLLVEPFEVIGAFVQVVAIRDARVGCELLQTGVNACAQDDVVGAVEGLSGTELMPADVYYISGVPSVVVAEDVVRIAVVAFVLCLLATIYPAWRASRTDPATALRYE